MFKGMLYYTTILKRVYSILFYCTSELYIIITEQTDKSRNCCKILIGTTLKLLLRNLLLLLSPLPLLAKKQELGTTSSASESILEQLRSSN
jgi:hypothetical protein